MPSATMINAKVKEIGSAGPSNPVAGMAKSGGCKDMTKSRQDAIVPRLNRVFSGRCSPSSCGYPGRRLGPDKVSFKPILEAITLV